jgi:hypothetical protein
MPTTTVNIANANLDLAAFDFRSVTERVDLPRKHECLDEEEGDGMSSTSSNYGCQTGCGNETPFMWIVEPGDTIGLQFQVEDLLNENPERPEFGWFEGGGDYFVRLAALDEAGSVLWQGDINEVSTNFHVGFSSFGPYQNAVVDVDRLVAQLPAGTKCWSFRVAVLSYLRPINSVNGDSEPEGTPSVGYSYIDFETDDVLEWDGTEYVSIGPNEADEVWYVANVGAWYQWTGTAWVGLPGAPEGSEPQEDYLYTMGYRLRQCNEKVVHFQSWQKGRDCVGFIHDMGRVVGGNVNNADYLGFWNMSDQFPSYTEPGTIVLNQFDGLPYQLTLGEWVAMDPPEADSFWIMANYQGWVYSGADPVAIVTVLAGMVLRFRAHSAYQRWTNIYESETPSLSAFQWSFKVRGSVEAESMPVERELSENGLLLSSTSRRVAKMRTVGLPETVVRIIQAVIAASDFTINGQSWSDVAALTKNNDKGALWWINSQLSRDDCKAKTEC